MDFAPLKKNKSQEEQINSSFEIMQRDIKYILNLRTDEVYLTLKVSGENKLLDNYEEKLTITDIQKMHQIFNNYSLFKKFYDYIKSQIENNKLEMLKINNESILIRLKQENIEIKINKKKLDIEGILRNIYDKIKKSENNQKNIEEKYKKLISDNKMVNQEILNLKSLNNDLKKENEEIKGDIIQLKEENKKLKEANIDLEKKLGIYKIIDEEINNIIKEDKNKSIFNIIDRIQEQNNKPNKLIPIKQLFNESKNNFNKKIKKLNLDNIDNNKLHKIENIKTFDLKKNELDFKNIKPRLKSFSRRSNTLNDCDFKEFEVIQEDYKQDEPNEFSIFNKGKIISDIYEENTFNNGENILDRDINSLNININRIPNLFKNNNKILRNSLYYNDLSIEHDINKKIIRNNKEINILKNSNDNLYNKTFTNMNIENINNQLNIIGNLNNRRKINNIHKSKTKESFDNDKERSYSNDNKRNEICKNNLKYLRRNFEETPIKFYRKKICYNHSKNKNNNVRKIIINKYDSKNGTNTENKQHKSKEIFNKFIKEKNNLFIINENKKENEEIINSPNIIIKYDNNYKLKLNENFKNYANIIKNHKGSNIINSTLQCLANVGQLVEYFLSSKEEIKMKYDQQPLSNAFLKMFKNLWENKSIKYYKPVKCISIILNQMNKFIYNFKEILVFIFDNLHQELNKAQDINQDLLNFFDDNFDKYFKNYEKYFNANFQSKISELFYIKYDSKITCLDCNNEFHNIQLSNILEFSLEKVKESNHINKKFITINDCFTYYNNYQDFGFSEKCIKCGQNQIFGKNNKLLKGPKVLIISVNGENDNEVKLIIDEVINLRDFFYDKENKYIYELINVIMYLGDDNFISFCKSFIDKKWYKYKYIDLEVIPCSFREINNNGTPYLLFYSLCQN